MTHVSLTEFISTNKKIEAGALYDDELLENSILNKFNDRVINASRGATENIKRFRWKCRHVTYYEQF